MDAFGDRITGVQLVRAGYGIASVHFRNGRAELDYCLPDISARAFTRGARAAMRKSTPARYGK